MRDDRDAIIESIARVEDAVRDTNRGGDRVTHFQVIHRDGILLIIALCSDGSMWQKTDGESVSFEFKQWRPVTAPPGYAFCNMDDFK